MRDAAARLLDALRSVLGRRGGSAPPPASPETHASARLDERLIAFDDLSTLAASLEPAELSRLIAEGLADPDARVRCAALGAIAGRAGALRRQPTAAIYQQWSRERPVLGRFTPEVLRALDDGSAQVRLAAVFALYHLAYLPSPSRAELDREVAGRLAEAFSRETSAGVAEEIVRTVAASQGHADDLQRSVLDRALDDSRPGVLAEALAGAASLQMGRGLGRAATLLGHDEPRVRLAAAHALGDYGRLALPHLEVVEWALATESDEKVRRALEGLVTWLEQHSA